MAEGASLHAAVSAAAEEGAAQCLPATAWPQWLCTTCSARLLRRRQQSHSHVVNDTAARSVCLSAGLPPPHQPLRVAFRSRGRRRKSWAGFRDGKIQLHAIKYSQKLITVSPCGVRQLANAKHPAVRQCYAASQSEFQHAQPKGIIGNIACSAMQQQARCYSKCGTSGPR